MDIPGLCSIEYPEMLVLGLGLAWLYARRLRVRNAWRLLLLGIAVLLLCRPSLLRPSTSLNLCVLVDRSRSISDESRGRQLEILEYVRDNLQPGDRVSVVSFNDQPHVEQGPASGLTIGSFENPWSEDATDLAGGLETALGLLGNDPNARVFLLSDGEYTERNPLGQARSARRQGAGIHYRDLKRRELFNLSVTDVRMPDKTLTNEPFRIVFQVNSTAATAGRYRLLRNDRVVNEEQAGGWTSYQFQRGENQIVFADAAGAAGIYSYRLEVEALGRAPEVMRNDNRAERFVQVVGERPVLLVNNTGQADNVAGILSAGNIPLHIVAIDGFRFDLRQMEGHKAIVLNNVPIITLTREQIEDVQRFVTQEGGGLLVCGGNRSFASGGYYMTAIDDILPVSLEDRQQSKKTATAFSIVLDRSGSMAMTTPSGKTKMALANNAAAECIRLMSGVDSVSLVAVDSAAHIIVPQKAVEDPGAIITRCLSVESMGGGIFVYTGLVAAAREVLGAKQLNKHILLFADAADAEEPGEYQKLLGELKKAGVTVSVVGLGTEADVDAEFLKDVAARGGGSVYFTQDAAQLVQFFTADTLTYTRNRFIEEPAPIVAGAAALTMAPHNRWQKFSCPQYNLLFARPDSNVALRTADADNAPVLAFWQRGLGRVVTLALDPNLAFAQHSQYGDIMLSAARWAMGSSVSDNLQISVDYQGSFANIRMEVSQEQQQRIGTPEIIVFTPDGKSIRKPLHWSSHDQLSASFKIAQPGLHRGVVRVAGEDYKIGPISMAVSPEFLQRNDPDFGRDTLRELASTTGGQRVQDVQQVFHRRGMQPIVRPLLLPLLVTFLLLTLCEIAEPRFGLLLRLKRMRSAFRTRIARRWRASAAGRKTRSPRRKSVRAAPEPTGRPARPARTGPEPNAPAEPIPPEAEPPADDMDYLRESKAKARRRLS